MRLRALILAVALLVMIPAPLFAGSLYVTETEDGTLIITDSPKSADYKRVDSSGQSFDVPDEVLKRQLAPIDEPTKGKARAEKSKPKKAPESAKSEKQSFSGRRPVPTWYLKQQWYREHAQKAPTRTIYRDTVIVRQPVILIRESEDYGETSEQYNERIRLEQAEALRQFEIKRQRDLDLSYPERNIGSQAPERKPYLHDDYPEMMDQEHY